MSKFTKKCMAIRTLSDRASGGMPYISLLNPCISVKTTLINTKLGILWISMCSVWLCGSIVAYPIIYWLVPSPSRLKISLFSKKTVATMWPRGNRIPIIWLAVEKWSLYFLLGVFPIRTDSISISRSRKRWSLCWVPSFLNAFLPTG